MHVEATAGEDVRLLIDRMFKLSRLTSEIVTSKHNGQDLAVDYKDPECTVQSVYDAWKAGMEASRKAWIESPEGQMYEAKRILIAQSSAAGTALAMRRLPPPGKPWQDDWKAWAVWLKAVIPHADHTSSGYDTILVYRRLCDAGVAVNQFCGKTPESDVEMMGWILGQVLSMADKGLPPHHALLRFIPHI